MGFVRSKFQIINNTRHFTNEVTAWIDGSTVYGSNA